MAVLSWLRTPAFTIKPMFHLFACAAVPFLALLNPGSAQSKLANDKHVVTEAQGYLNTCSTLGWSGTVLIERKGKIVLHQGFGLADREANRPCEPGTLFEIASATKPFTACVIMALEQEGKLSLKDSISKHLPGVPKERGNITIAHLLAHMSGMPRSAVGGGGLDLETAVEAYFSGEPSAEPGKQHEYWNGGYALLAGIIEQVSGVSYMEACREYVFQPAGMASSGFTGEAMAKERQARGYSDRGSRLAAEHPYGGSYGWQYKGMGGLVTNAGDLLAFTRAFKAGKIVNKQAVKRMWTPHSEFYGLGWGIADNTPSGGRRVGHGGDVAGFHTSYQYFADDDATIIVLCNHDLIPAWKTGWDLESILFGKEPTNLALPKVVTVSAKSLKSLAGFYAAPAGGSIELQEIPGGLLVIAHGLQAATLLLGGNTSSQPLVEAQECFDQMLTAIQKGDVNTVASQIAERIPKNWANRLCEQIWPAHVREHGPLQGCQLLSIKDQGTGMVSLWGCMQHEKGQTHVNANFERGKLCYLNFDSNDLPPSARIRCVPVGNDLWVGFDLENNKVTIEIHALLKGSQVIGIEIGSEGATKQTLKRAEDVGSK